jgi:hypothetical protein
LYKKLHSQYCYDHAVKKPRAVSSNTFEDTEKKFDQITVLSLIKLIKDFKLENGLSHNLLKDEVFKLVKAINIHIMKVPGDLLTLSFDGFVHFLLQYSHYHWAGSEMKAYSLVEKLFNQMRESPLFNKLGLVMTKTETTARKEISLLE